MAARFPQPKKRKMEDERMEDSSLDSGDHQNKIIIKHDMMLGKGVFSTVYVGTFENQFVAVKRIPSTNLSNNREEDVLQKLNHVNIIKLYYAENQSSDDFRCFALELCAASMDKLFFHDEDVKKYRGPRPGKKDGLLQMADGLEYLHSKRLIHRDIKPQNILISNTTPVHLKWADFGFVKEVTDHGTHSFRSGVHGTLEWAAPEILTLREGIRSRASVGDDERGTIMSDVFSAGMVFFCWLTDGIHPFGNSSVMIGYHIITNNLVNFSRLDAVVDPTHFVYGMLKDGMMNPNHDLRTSMDKIKAMVMDFHRSTELNEGS